MNLIQGEGLASDGSRSGLCALIDARSCQGKAAGFYLTQGVDVFSFEHFCVVPIFGSAPLLLPMWPRFY